MGALKEVIATYIEEDGKIKITETPLIRCGECKHSKEWYRDRRFCYLWAEAGVSVFEDGYCNYGERRE